jgi:chromosome partitioning protein
VTARIITVANQKGGAGKSTIAMALAGCLAERGARVLLADGDRQGTASYWAAAAPDERPFPASVVSLAAADGKVHRELQKHIENYDYVIVDCPPSVGSLVPASALLVSDLVLVPVTLSPADLLATQGMRELIERAQVTNEGLKAYLVPNRVQRTSVAAQVREVLETLGLPVTSSSLGLRTAFQEACGAGVTVAALGASAKTAADEVGALTTEIQQLLGTPDG